MQKSPYRWPPKIITTSVSDRYVSVE
uniref:Uncharacterized protein n=1 Tax=Anguilla anguilla TaxID=7936 RepID=A0A0E9P9N6_ANGAN